MKKKKSKRTSIIIQSSSNNIEDTIPSSCQRLDGKKVAALCIPVCPLDGKRVAMARPVEISHLVQHLIHRSSATLKTVRNVHHTLQPLEKPTPNVFQEQPKKRKKHPLQVYPATHRPLSSRFRFDLRPDSPDDSAH